MQRDFTAQRLELARQALSEGEAAAAWEEGRALLLDEAVAEALQQC